MQPRRFKVGFIELSRLNEDIPYTQFFMRPEQICTMEYNGFKTIINYNGRSIEVLQTPSEVISLMYEHKQEERRKRENI